MALVFDGGCRYQVLYFEGWQLPKYPILLGINGRPQKQSSWSDMDTVSMSLIQVSLILKPLPFPDAWLSSPNPFAFLLLLNIPNVQSSTQYLVWVASSVGLDDRPSIYRIHLPIGWKHHWGLLQACVMTLILWVLGVAITHTTGEAQCSSSNRSRGHLRHHYIPSASPAFDPVGAKEVFMNQMSQEMEEVLSKTCSFLVASMTK